jgi:uncharacterized protein YecE (DUF72 family)
MARRAPPRDDQPGLFGATEPESPPSTPPEPERVVPVPVDDDTARLARALPANIHLGTSSWSFPGWAGLVYAREESQTSLARHGLRAYASCPIFRSVGVDKTFYRPALERDYAEMARAVPAGFRFLVKAFQGLTQPHEHYRSQDEAARQAARAAVAESALFLDASYARDFIVAPTVQGLGETCGPIVFQFPALRLANLGGAAKLIDRLFRFLDALPKGPLYGVEVRNSTLLTPAYAQALRDAGAVHVYNVHPAAGALEQQLALMPPVSLARPLVVRWMLNLKFSYEGAAERYAPFARLVDEDPHHRAEIARLCREIAAINQPVYVIANNKAEGSAPGTIRKLAEKLVG